MTTIRINTTRTHSLFVKNGIRVPVDVPARSVQASAITIRTVANTDTLHSIGR